MSAPFLITYASRTDSTVGVAEAIGRVLAETGLRTDVLPMSAVKNLTFYGSVVAGSAIQGGAWLPEAMQFLRANQASLRSKPFAAFQVCMTLAMRDAENYRQHVSTWMEPVRQIVRPVSEASFAGALELAKVPSLSDRLKFRISVMMGVWKEGDHRDWAAIDKWARTLEKALR
jgi:menaquinone-dependent protoporphyrinogen oxidase